jgi:hypothetical protein
LLLKVKGRGGVQNAGGVQHIELDRLQGERAVAHEDQLPHPHPGRKINAKAQSLDRAKTAVRMPHNPLGRKHLYKRGTGKPLHENLLGPGDAERSLGGQGELPVLVWKTRDRHPELNLGSERPGEIEILHAKARGDLRQGKDLPGLYQLPGAPGWSAQRPRRGALQQGGVHRGERERVKARESRGNWES